MHTRDSKNNDIFSIAHEISRIIEKRTPQNKPSPCLNKDGIAESYLFVHRKREEILRENAHADDLSLEIVIQIYLARRDGFNSTISYLCETISQSPNQVLKSIIYLKSRGLILHDRKNHEESKRFLTISDELYHKIETVFCK